MQGHDRAPLSPTVMPADTSYPRAVRVLTRDNLLRTWRGSRDATKKPGAKGVDGISARQFKANLEFHLDRILLDVKRSSYRYSRLRPFFIPKKNGRRVICVPTIADRLVQRTVAQYLAKVDRLRLLNEVSYGFILERGVAKAVKEAKAIRTSREWVLKTDIQSFFDRIDRTKLKEQIRRRLGRHSLVPFLSAAVDCELRPASPEEAKELKSLGIRVGLGLRQGMPLSPLLANLCLADFDRAAIAAKYKIIRYADDLILFGDSRAEVEDGYNFIADELKKVGHSIPCPGPGSKTEFVAPKQPVEFLGLEIVHKETAGGYVCRIPKSVKAGILSDIADKSSLANAIKGGSTFNDVRSRLAGLPNSYASAFQLAEDWHSFEPQVMAACSNALVRLYNDIFGTAIIQGLPDNYKRFLGISGFSPQDD